MTTSGQIKCPSCGGSIGLTCVCRPVVLRGRVHGSGRFEGPIEISEKPLVDVPDWGQGIDDPARPRFIALGIFVVLAILAALAVFVIVFKP